MANHRTFSVLLATPLSSVCSLIRMVSFWYKILTTGFRQALTATYLHQNSYITESHTVLRSDGCGYIYFLFFSHLKVNSDIICVTSKINLSLENSLVRLCAPVSPSCRGQKSCFPADLRLIKGWRQDLGGWICSLVCQFVCNENSNMIFF